MRPSPSQVLSPWVWIYSGLVLALWTLALAIPSSGLLTALAFVATLPIGVFVQIALLACRRRSNSLAGW